MKILVLSDSHSALRFMRQCIDTLKPDAVVHLGDHYDDGEAMAEEYPEIRFYRVPGNCDKYCNVPWAPETLVERVCGVKLFMTHGHLHGVKMGLGALLRDAQTTDAQAVLFGHTHCALCYCTEQGLWVLNPGSCGYGGGSAGLIIAENGKISDCRLLRQSDLEDVG
jgi:putative phosphoesterase